MSTLQSDWPDVVHAFDQSLGMTPTDRSHFLASVPERIASRVVRLLADFDGPDAPISPAMVLLAETLDARTAAVDIAPGDRLGPYEIVREIGRGGMGAVYEAIRRDADFAKRVAIKTIAVGRGSAMMEERFRRERRILAQLEHRNIAALLDGGVSADGTPWFAMEYVDGDPIDRYCERRHLSMRTRTQLLSQVAAAVHVAHRNLVVHRDLKPSNILVTKDGVVKLLDFGIARLLSDESAGDHTTGFLVPVTTAFASPEQLRGEPVSTASDIHALGVVAAVVLSGRHPFRDAATPTAEIRRRILDERTPTLALRGDLAAIVHMALRKEPERRYASAALLADDLQNFLQHRPVVARGDAVGYQVSRFLQRHTVPVLAAAVALVALIAALLVTRRQAAELEEQRDRARLEAEKATEVSEFVQGMLRSADPRLSGSSLTVAQALETATRSADSSLAASPEVHAAVLTAIGQGYRGLGMPDQAEPLFRRALALNETVSRAPDARIARSLMRLGEVYSDRGEAAAADSALSAAVAMLALDATDSASWASALTALGDVQQYRGNLAAAERSQHQALTIASAYHGEHSAEAASAMNNMAVILGQQERWSDAEALQRRALTIVTKTLGPRHPDVAASLNSLAGTVQSQGRLAQAESLFRAALDIRLTTLGHSHPEVSWSYTNLGWLLQEANRCTEAVVYADSVVALRAREAIGDDHPMTASAFALSGQCHTAMGHGDVAVRQLRVALRLRRASLPPTHWLLSVTESLLGAALRADGQPVEAAMLLQRGYVGLRAARGDQHALTRAAKARLETLARP